MIEQQADKKKRTPSPGANLSKKELKEEAVRLTQEVSDLTDTIDKASATRTEKNAALRAIKGRLLTIEIDEEAEKQKAK
jgi:FtsZ-binding cell division protein ZapB